MSEDGLRVAFINGKFPDYYALLELDRRASQRDITVAYRKQALSQHPDKLDGSSVQNEAFAHINNARDVLSDPERRREYDARLAEAESQSQSSNTQEQNGKSSSHPQTRRDASPTPQAQSGGWNKPGFWGSWAQPGLQTPPSDRPRPPVPQPNPNYIPPGFPVVFHRFVPPASAYPFNPLQGMFGIQPNMFSVWGRAIFNGKSLFLSHENVCHLATKLCGLAQRIDQMIEGIKGSAAKNINLPPISNDPLLSHQRLDVAIELLTEIMHFAASSYYHHRGQVDQAPTQSPEFAMTAVQNQARILDRVIAIMDSTQNGLIPVAGQLLNSQRKVLDSILKVDEICQQWSDFCELPANLQEGMKDTFCATFEQWTNKWERRRRADLFGGYKTLPFILKETSSTRKDQAKSKSQQQSVQRQAPPPPNEPRAGVWGSKSNYEYSYEEMPERKGPPAPKSYQPQPGKEWFFAKMAATTASFGAQGAYAGEEMGQGATKGVDVTKPKDEFEDI